MYTLILLILLMAILVTSHSTESSSNDTSNNSKQIEKSRKKDGLHDFHPLPLDLMIVNGELKGISYIDHVVMCIEHGEDSTFASLLKIKFNIAMNQSLGIQCKHYYQRIVFPNDMLRPFFTKKSKPSLSIKKRLEIECVLNTLKCSVEWRRANGDIPLFCFGIFAFEFGANGFFYSFNHLLQSSPKPRLNDSLSFFNEMHEKYFRMKPRLLVNSAVASGVKAGDLVKIKALKPQRNQSLQIRARYFDGSFGEISTFISGDVIRKNSRNQTEFAVQSLFDSKRLALRPKYLCRITYIHIHKISDQYPFDQFRALILSLSDNGSNDILYLPHKMSGKLAISVMDEYSILMLQQRHRQIFDVGILAVTQLWQYDVKAFEISHQILSFPFFINTDIWDRIMTKMKMKSNPQKMMKKISGLLDSITAKFMKIRLDKEQDITRLMVAWRSKIESDFKVSVRQHRSGYENLFCVIKDEMLASIQELHPDYLRQYSPDHNMTIFGRIKNLHRLSVIQNYLKANSKGHDLHVVCYNDERRGFLRGLNAALAERVNVEWNIHNMNVSKILTNRIVQFQQY